MYPTHDMNPIAIEHMLRQRLQADMAFVDRHGSERPKGPRTGIPWPLPFWRWAMQTKRERFARRQGRTGPTP